MFGQSIHASRGERERALPGDDLISRPTASLTHAVTIRRSRREVWPWLVQMGAGRAGWYSYDFLDNGRQRSAEWIVPELQHIEVGALMPAMPGVTEGFTVLCFERERYLVIGWLPDGAPPMMTWAFVLEEVSPRCTRLLVRARGGTGYRPPFGIPVWAGKTVMPAMHFIMQRKQLLEIVRRAEGRVPSPRRESRRSNPAPDRARGVDPSSVRVGR